MGVEKPTKSSKRPKPDNEVCGTANSESQSSVEFSRDAKGVGRWSIKLYGNRAEMPAIVEELKNLDQLIREKL